MIDLPATRPPENFGLPQLRQRQPLYDPSFPFVVLWSEKAACTTVVRWFFHHCGLLETALAHSGWIHDYENAIFKARPGYLESVLEAIRAGVPVVKFVRDPFARAYSGYLEVCRPAVTATKDHWARPVRARVLRALAATDAEVEYTFSFRQYVEWLVAQDPPTINTHLAPQYLGRDGFFAHRAFQVESMRDAFQTLEAEADRPTTLADDGYESGHHHTKTATLSRHQQLGLLELGVPLRRGAGFPYPSFDRTLARGTVYESLLGRFFERDLVLYGY